MLRLTLKRFWFRALHVMPGSKTRLLARRHPGTLTM